MKMALFTVSFAGFWGQAALTLEQAIEKTAALGFAGIEIMGKRPHLSVLDHSVEDCLRLRDRMGKLGLELAALAAYTNFTGGMESAEVPFVEMQILHVAELARRTVALGGNLLRVFTSYERTDMPLTKQWDITVAALRECCDRAGEFGVTIGVQNHHDMGVDTKSLLALLEEVDRRNVIPMYDCWSPHLRGEDLAAGVKRMAGKMRMTTVADYVVLPRWQYQPAATNYIAVEPPLARAVPMGKGDLDYKTFFSTLSKEKFDGWVSYEMCSPLRGGGGLANLEKYARDFLNYMRPYVGKS